MYSGQAFLYFRVSVFNEATDSETHKSEYSYDKDNRTTEVKYNGSNSTKVNYTYDKLNRMTNRTVTNGATYATQFGYVQGATAYGTNATTPLVVLSILFRTFEQKICGCR